MSFKYLPESFTISDACKSIRADMKGILEIMTRGESDIAFEDLFLSIIQTLRALEDNVSK